MAARSDKSPQRLRLRKYANRRYYDITHSRHVTLDEIHRLVRDGHDIEVTDSKTGEDLTAKVLAQIILEHETLKLEIFPIELLHRLIRANEPIVREFLDKYFTQAFLAFTDSQEQFNAQLRRAMGLPAPFAPAAWSRMVFGPFAAPFAAASAEEAGVPPGGGERGGSEPGGEDLRDQLEALRQQIAALQQQLDGGPKGAAAG